MKLNDKDIDLLVRLFKMEVSELHLFCKDILLKYYNENNIVEKDDSYLIAIGSKVGLVAHLDTSGNRYPSHIVYNDKYITAIDSILGADDRTGVFIVFKILEMGYRPTIILTHGEERGGIGAREFVSEYSDIGVNYLIQLDRRGDDVVFYDNGNQDFIDYVLSFRNKEGFGSFSDISILCPNCNVSGCNLGVGYFNEHSCSEYQDIVILEDTIEVVANMLDDECNTELFEYEEVAKSGMYDLHNIEQEVEYINYNGQILTLDEYYEVIYGRELQ